MNDTINNYWVSSWIEVHVREEVIRFRGGGTTTKRTFVVVNTATGVEEEISEWAAMAMCITPDCTITVDNWEDFCTGRGIFVEDI